MILVVDNYDSFTWNLVQLLGELGARSRVVRSDAITAAEVRALEPEGILLSPGPGTPDEAGVTLALIAAETGRTPLLGVCLGHQAIAQAFGGRIVRARRPMHGRTSPVLHDGTGVFAGLPSPLEAMRYHSLVVEPGSLPPDLVRTARTADGEVMGLRHRALPIEGVQFHPESFLSTWGGPLLANFLGRLPHRGAAPDRP